MTQDYTPNASFVDFAGEDDINIEIDHAISELNFEEAGKLQASLNNDNSEEIQRQVDGALARNQSLIEGYHQDAEKSIIQIELEIDTKLSKLVKDYKNRFLQMKAAQLEEIEQLRSEWISSHDRAEQLGNQKVESLLYTSKVLANCKCFDEAKTLRNNVQENTDNILKNECKEIDNHYKQHMINMIARHESMLDGLYNQLLNDIKIIEGQGKIDRSVVKSQEKIGIAMSPSKSIQNVATSRDISMNDKKLIISQLSPRKSPSPSSKSPRSPRSPRSPVAPGAYMSPLSPRY
ncbi:hypothetical protein TVAG_149360 [Trichomonas vaginalis G3]|uniref:Uncharacterized protein n=1 Tax=Trichomonas vaginalis (strain ATCC PRA-98 / G3) TaxID=412133 RepID=A2ELK3_TRIV3|nr:hypothetical protein TVAGG3_0163290 [Trichomonas vaginalis G3]EAY06450.1 hypothetical protein TVAG_149360 [Trichomonas vaginalis G3]KAI5548022.1 hypothetical protein TVAGG3_0163290 [Trichomonas vaginalis G3]|eukprot:XP_001318673.1 hypothetical protein [Trichomonas vaginalis G3]